MRIVGRLAVAAMIGFAGACGGDNATGPQEQGKFDDLTGIFGGTVTPEGTNSIAASLSTVQSGAQVSASLSAGAMTGSFALALSGAVLEGSGTTSITCDGPVTVTDDAAELDLRVSDDLSTLTGTLEALVCVFGNSGPVLSKGTVSLSR